MVCITNLTQSAEYPVEVQRWRPCWRESLGRESGGLGPLLFQDGSHHLIGYLSVSFATLTFPDVSLCFDEKMFHLDKLVAVDRSGPFSPQRWSRCRCRTLGWLFVTCEHQYKMQKIYNFQIKWFVPVYEEDKDCRPEGDVKGNHCQGEDIVHSWT